MNSSRKIRLASWLIAAVIATLIFPLSSVYAQSGTIQPVAGTPLYGHFCTAVGGVSLNESPYSDSFTLSVPGTPVHAAWMWSGRSLQTPQLGDEDIVVNANGTSMTLTASQSLSQADGRRTWHTNFYADAALASVQTGSNSYTVSGLSINGNNAENHGAALVVIYEESGCPYQRIDLDFGLDSFRNGAQAPLGPDSEMVCNAFPAANVDRMLSADLLVGGIENDRRGNAIWTITGNGESPSGNITPTSGGSAYPGATEIVDPLNGIPGPEFDIYSLSIAVPAGDTYACYQVESRETEEDPWGISAVLFGAVSSLPMEAPEIDIQKTPDLQTVVSGSTVPFAIRVENTGPVALTNVVVTDPLAPGCDATIEALAPSEIASYECTLENVTDGFTNVASVTGTPPYGANVSDSDEAVVEVINPAIDIQKTPDMQTVVAGTPVTFTIAVKNIGDATLTNVEVSDSLAPACDHVVGTLAPNATASYSCVLEVASASFTNVASVLGLPPVGPVVSDSDDADVLVINPAIRITKSPEGQTVEKGDSVVFDILVENVGDVALSDVIVTDALTPACDLTVGDLAVEQSVRYQCALAVATESFTNVAKVVGKSPIGSMVNDEDSANVTVIGPAIDIQKTPDLQSVPSGSDVMFDILVTNTGDVALTNISVVDAITPACDLTIGDLAVGASHSYSCQMSNVTDNVVNVAKVSGRSPLGTIVTDEDSAEVETANIAIEKTPDTQTVVAGSDIIFAIKVHNTGNVVLTNVTVVDAIAPQCNFTVGELQPDESYSYSCIMPTVNESLINSATVTGQLPSGEQVEDEDSASVNVIHPSIVISKTPDLQTVLAGTAVDFTIRVQNNGDVALSNVTVTDPQVPACGWVIGDLAVGAFAEQTCQLDAATVDFTNVAMVSGAPPVGPDVTDEDSADVDVLNPAISIEKLPDMQQIRVDGTAEFTIRVKNTGDTPLFGVAITDALTADCNRQLGDLRPGDSRTYVCEAADVKADFVNVAKVAGNTVLDTQVADEDDAVVDVINPAIDITKTAVEESISLGDNAEFTIRVENTGDVALTNVAVTDQIAPECARELGTLNAGDIREYSCEMANVRETTTNVAVVTGTPTAGSDVTDTDDARVEVPKAKMTIDKVDNIESISPGGAIEYTISYANEGPGDAFDVVLVEVVPEHTTFDAANSDSGWTCEENSIIAGTACRYEVGDMPAGTVGTPVLFAVQINAIVPKNVQKIVNQVTVDGVNLSPSGNSIAVEETPMTATSLDVVDEPGSFSRLIYRLFVPLAK